MAGQADRRREGGCRFCIDRGGTFTDVYAETPKGNMVMKLLSVDPQNYEDAPREGIRRILQKVYSMDIPKNKVPTENIEWIRMGTTVATNALLERKGSKTALAITAGFRDLLLIGTQARPAIFDLSVRRLEMLYSEVVEVAERVRLVDDDYARSAQGVHKGVSGEWVEVLEEPNEDKVRQDLQAVYDKGFRSLAVVLIHSYTYNEHERLVARIAKDIGFDLVSMSSELMSMIRMVPRGLTACVDAYLTPLIVDYIKGFRSGFEGELKGVNVSFMQSDGGLCDADKFYGFKAILSGPAGGVVGYSQTTWDNETKKPVIGFDMGGTSTDVSRYGGFYDHVYETHCAGVTIQAPQLDINTVAAGGGSICEYKQGRFKVGPESAGAHPGPVCYRKGGPLAVTDCNLALGRILPEYFPKIFGPGEDQPLDKEATVKAFEEVAKEIERDSGKKLSPAEVAIGFVKVANEAMCRPIRSLTEAKGYSTADHVLACFGGAGGQHACAIARTLGMSTVFIHRYSGILSAYGIGLADVVAEEQEPAQCVYKEGVDKEGGEIRRRLDGLREIVTKRLRAEGFEDSRIRVEDYLNLRYDRTGISFMMAIPPDGNVIGSFCDMYEREYGFTIPGRDIIIDDIRVRGIGAGIPLQKEEIPAGEESPKPRDFSETYFEPEGWQRTPVYFLDDLGYGHSIPGPAVIMQGSSTIVVEPSCTAVITKTGDVRIDVSEVVRTKVTTEMQPVTLSIFSHRFMSIAEQMGRALQRTAISTNIKERLDFSCALFGPDGGLVANAPHIPVHLGAMGATVRAQRDLLGDDWKEGDVVMTNHPAVGGSHLPDITVITPVFHNGKPVFYVACRGHHADIGGTTPGSIPPFSKLLVEEGAHIQSYKMVQKGVFQDEGVTELLMSPAKVPRQPNEEPLSGTRTLEDNLADLRAQAAANQKGINLMKELIAEYGLEVVEAYMGHVQANAEKAVREMLVEVADRHGTVMTASDQMDDGTEIHLKVTLDRETRSATFDFTGTDPQVYGNHNCPTAVVSSAVLYCLRCMIKEEIPLNQGCMQPVKIIVPPNTLLSPHESCAVVGGNVLTSQRVTDVILEAFKAAANSQGDTNNLTFGDDTFGYYETIAGGAGAGPGWEGTSGVHTHMTNTRITDAEILERRYPVLLTTFTIRNGSGGEGKWRGGDGVVRELIFLRPLKLGILSERRSVPPKGGDGGGCGRRGKNTLTRYEEEKREELRKSGRAVWTTRTEGTRLNFGAKNSARVDIGDRLRIETPGGGGWGV